ncbi:MAG TPA: phage shock protein PspA [Alteromonas australica]|jgi:phage shock protein A|uniref:Phage shock protein n=1 Tax=Alteromonas australica TaxID=589873 RepID=A0A075P2I9_9ALTE|nr:phage shock protein PspA [Alteromonas australica]MAF70920.1 phage shock protein PspA [Alteromonas sp.]AIG00062.1 phage shock protein [Alteromonas australica]AJP45018.1 phage shock protein [Alteromonas australica]MBU34108.1 phage shock protein PspA [Alteromonas sp.]HAI70981.1 phage shock protein PspA [Alteromonas australica]|tara:strand:- start:22 stop:684 length:663 start_codon:yes stop_codon:yes gene_type:complete
MGMFSRINDIVQANLNAMLDKAEDPEKIIRMIIQEMEETLVEVRSDAARFIAEQKTLNRQLLAVNKEVNNWQRKAQLAMDNDKESLAKAALVEKHKYVDKAAAINEQLTQLSESIEKLQIDTARLNEKMREAKQKQKALITRKQTVSARLKVKTSQNSTKIDDAMMRFEHYEQRIDHLEAQVEAYDLPEKTVSLNEEFADLERDETIENELAELKKSKVA